MSKGVNRLFLLLLAVSLLLCGCQASPEEQFGEPYEAVRLFHKEYEAVTRGEMDFLMEATFRDPETGETGVLYFLQGNGRYDKELQTAWQAFDATLLGASYRSEEYFASGDKVHIENGETYHLPTEADTFFQAFPYSTIPLPALASLKELEQSPASNGTLYKLVATEGQKRLVEEIWKLDLYALTGIASPDKEKESYGEMTYTVLEKDGRLCSVLVEFTVSIYKKAGYTPGYTPTGDENRLELKIKAKVELKSIGESVDIPTYEETSDTASEE